MTLSEIESLTKDFAAAHDHLAELIESLERQKQEIERAAMPALKRAVAVAASRKADLHHAVENSPEHFEKPRTQIFHGVKIGFAKERGRVEIADPARTIELLKRRFGHEAMAYIRTKEEVDKTTVPMLPGNELKKLGIEIISDTDAVLIKPVDGEVEKIVAALLKSATEEAQAA